MDPGRLVALEGIDGSGKTTQAARLAATLGAFLTCEPGGTLLGRQLRALLLDPDGTGPAPRTEALLVAADRAEHVEREIVPRLAAGTWVVSDRYAASTLAYQGYGRGLDLAELRDLVEYATAGLAADLNVLVDVPVEVARQRYDADGGDRLERLDAGFHARVRAGYGALAAEDPEHWVVVDGTGDEDSVAARILAAVRDLLPGARIAP